MTDFLDHGKIPQWGSPGILAPGEFFLGYVVCASNSLGWHFITWCGSHSEVSLSERCEQ